MPTNLTQDLQKLFLEIKVSSCPFRVWPLCSGYLEFCEEYACLPQPRLQTFTHFTQGTEQLSVTAFTHQPSPSVICTLLSFLPLFSCAACQLLDVQSSFCTQIWSRSSIRNQYFKWYFAEKIIMIVKSKYFAILESSKNILYVSWQETIIKLSSNCSCCGKVRMLDYKCQHAKIKTA